LMSRILPHPFETLPHPTEVTAPVVKIIDRRYHSATYDNLTRHVFVVLFFRRPFKTF
jgi:hypothetical protein